MAFLFLFPLIYKIIYTTTTFETRVPKIEVIQKYRFFMNWKINGQEYRTIDGRTDTLVFLMLVSYSALQLGYES